MVMIFNVPFVPPVAMPQLASESRLRDQGIRDKRAMIDLATVPWGSHALQICHVIIQNHLQEKKRWIFPEIKALSLDFSQVPCAT